MFVRFVFVTLLLCLSASPVLASDPEVTPKEIAGFRLGSDITEYPEIEYTNYLKEVVVNDWYGFRKGIISYGICAYPGEIVKIRMKYEDSSKEFYEVLLKKFRQTYGKPTQWKGDAFGVNFIWKWVFFDNEDNQVNMILQHNLMDQDENIGTVVKLSYPEREEEERLCFIDMCEETQTPEEKARRMNAKTPDWQNLIPR